ncbi:hypothetical protein RchiOBHm_Chr4g0424621 [Rosa chinensis]|uniref:Uncharacterized protein n=1 Tax=Rosa chinensis TaxID=74649 RepID=A0A2P6QYX0_ROSCH|nr:hypothetical protein RchiOBHm_Chr4g0424621 [Rosa chinensis]
MAPRPCFEIRTPTGLTVLHRVYPSRLVRLRAPNICDGGTEHNRHQVSLIWRNGGHDAHLQDCYSNSPERLY